MEDVIARYRAASEANKIAELIATLAPDVELVSPISGHLVFRGTEDVGMLARAVYGSLRGLHWHREIGEGPVRVVLGRASIGPVTLYDAMVFELAADGRIQRITPHLRPWLALTLFALVLGPQVARHPGAVLRALRRP